MANLHEIACGRGGPSGMPAIVRACASCALAIVVELRAVRTLPAAEGSAPRRRRLGAVVEREGRGRLRPP